jgi:NTE family protein
MTAPRPSIALALSGGGIRAMVFHLGVMKHLAERGLLEDVGRVSTVSGGSLLVGLLLQQNLMRWPTSEQFLARSLPALRESLCMRSLQWGAARQLLNPLNWRFMLSRANLLARALQREWQVRGALGDLPEAPEWAINGTTAENGKRFRFKRHDIGDYALGYASAERFPLASALAVSAAFPGGFGPLTLDARRFDWRRRSWDEPPDANKPVEATFRRLHLYDGGVYDNMGLEPFFDAGRQRPKHPGAFIICSDAGAPLASGFNEGPLNVFRLKRVADIMSDQSRSLRVRAFAQFLQQTPSGGAYLCINTAISGEQRCPSAKFAALFPTTLRRLDHDEFDRIAVHGQAVAERFRKDFGML